MAANPIRRVRDGSIRKWAEGQARVDSCIWVHDHDNLGNDTGHFDVSFLYTSEDSTQPHHGRFCSPGCREVAPYRSGEPLQIQYNAKKPGRYRLPWAESNLNYEKLEAIVVMALFALAAGYFLNHF